MSSETFAANATMWYHAVPFALLSSPQHWQKTTFTVVARSFPDWQKVLSFSFGTTFCGRYLVYNLLGGIWYTTLRGRSRWTLDCINQFKPCTAVNTANGHRNTISLFPNKPDWNWWSQRNFHQERKESKASSVNSLLFTVISEQCSLVNQVNCPSALTTSR